MGEQIVLGMSGGVDSSVAALLLMEQGYDVQCIFMKNWEEDDTDFECTSEVDYRDALAVCDTLKLPLHSVNFSKQYWDKVFTHFIEEYRQGRTPNPDILCNKEIKFKVFLDYAFELGSKRIATGHYACIRVQNERYLLVKGNDNKKDQSYFLYTLGQRELSHSLFPIGHLTKTEVRDIARQKGLPTHEKKDSTGICFIGERDFKSFLSHYLPAQPGEIITTNGKTAGRHDGLMYYTLGQRKGIGVGGGYGDKEAPWFVAEKNLEHNQLVIAQGHDHPNLYESSLAATDLHWVDKYPEINTSLKAKIRYRQKDQSCTITSINTRSVDVHFDKPQFAISPGQSIVFYDDDVCLGGGIINHIIK